jgi:maleylpyruvate isomerase
MKLYGYWRSSATYRVRIALGLKRLSYEIAPVHLLKDGGEQFTGEFEAMNPMSQVPVLEVEHQSRTVRLGQSLAILEYLEETHPEPPLLPSDPVLRARTRQLAEIVNSGIQPLQNLSVGKRVRDLGGDSNAFSAHFIERGLRAFEAIARETAGTFCVGDRPSFADCVLVPQLYAARRVNVEVAAFPLLARIEAHCAELPAFAAAHPDRQPDAAT